MFAKRILNYCLTFFTCYIMSVDAITVDRVHQMTELLKYPGWRDFGALEIVDDGNHYKVDHLLSADADGQSLVTEGNVDRKVQQAHHFLSCNYAILFLTYHIYVIGIGNQCGNTMDSASGSSSVKLQCLNTFKHTLNKELLVLRMQSALSYFNSISPQTALKNYVFDILTSFGDAYEMTNRPNYTNSDNIWHTLKQLYGLEKNALEFFKHFCGQTNHLKEIHITSSSAYSRAIEVVQEIFYKPSHPIDKANDTYTMVNYIINDFLVSHYTRMGFAFDSELNTTVLNENPKTHERVQQLNKLLSYSGWHDLDYLKIMIHSRLQGKEDLLAADVGGQIVNEENVDSKIRLVYELMSCHYVEFLKELLVYKKSILQSFDFNSLSSTEKLVFIKSFVEINKNSYPVIMRMLGALLYFHQLSPRTDFNKDISKILDYFKHSIEILNFDRSNFVFIYEHNNQKIKLIDELKLQLKMDHILKNVTNIKTQLNKYSWMFCVVPINYTSLALKYFVPNKLDINKVMKLNKKVSLFIDVVFPKFGFIYNPLSSTTVTLKSNNSEEWFDIEV